MEALLLVASKTGIELPQGDLTPADLALLIWLNDPDQLRRANCERIVLRFQSFYCFMNRTLEAPLFEMPADGVLQRLQERTNQFNRNRRRGGGAAVWMYEFGNEVAFLIRFGGSLKRDEVMDNDQCRPDIRRPVGYDLVVYNIETGELRVRADLVMRPWFTSRPCERTKRSHINMAVYDSSWEGSEAYALDHSDLVDSWVKNDHLGFEILYVYRGVVRKYRPDFLVRMKSGVMLIVEIKGEETDETQAKHKFLEEWVKAINETKSFGVWAWTVITDPRKIEGHLQEIA